MNVSGEMAGTSECSCVELKTISFVSRFFLIFYADVQYVQVFTSKMTLLQKPSLYPNLNKLLVSSFFHVNFKLVTGIK